MLVNVFKEQIMMFESIPPLRREVVHGDGNYFYLTAL